jgi:hypothetical protein
MACFGGAFDWLRLLNFIDAMIQIKVAMIVYRCATVTFLVISAGFDNYWLIAIGDRKSAASLGI